MVKPHARTVLVCPTACALCDVCSDRIGLLSFNIDICGLNQRKTAHSAGLEWMASWPPCALIERSWGRKREERKWARLFQHSFDKNYFDIFAFAVEHCPSSFTLFFTQQLQMKLVIRTTNNLINFSANHFSPTSDLLHSLHTSGGTKYSRAQ